MDYVRYFRDNPTFITTTDTRLAQVIMWAGRLPHESLLDVGCGSGHLLDQLSQRITSRLVGVDVQEQVGNGWEYQIADITSGLPFVDSEFELVICGEVVEHVPDPDFLVEEIRRVLRPGGSLILTTPNLASWANRMLLPLGFQPLFTETSSRVNLGRRFKVLGQGGKVQGHLKIFTRHSLEELLNRSGYVVSRVHGLPFCFPRPVSRIDEFLARWPSFASGLLVVAQNPLESGEGDTAIY